MKVRYPEAYRRLYRDILAAMRAVPIRDPTEEEAREMTTKALDLFDHPANYGPDLEWPGEFPE